MPETAVPCEPVAQGAVPVPRKKPVPEGWKLAEGLAVLFREDVVADSTTVWMIWISVTRWMGCTMIVVCIIMTTGSAITKKHRRHRISATVLLDKHELLHSVSPGNTSRYCARGRGLRRSLAILASQRSESDLADARAGKLVGDFGEGLGVDVWVICGRAAGKDSRAPVCCDGRELDWDGYAAHVGVVSCSSLAGSVGGAC
jgi:hypothetical protein